MTTRCTTCNKTIEFCNDCEALLEYCTCDRGLGFTCDDCLETTILIIGIDFPAPHDDGPRP